MKLLLVGDNRDVHNWGCRATSISLSQLLGNIAMVTEIIDKHTVDTRIPVGLGILNRKITGRFHPWILKLLSATELPEFARRMMPVQKDYIVHDPARSVENLLRYKEQDDRLHAIYEKVSAADIIVINGEGGMIFTTPPRRDLQFQLMIIELAADHFKKPVFYVNAMMSDCPVHGRDQRTATIATSTLMKCNAVAFRDYRSVELCKVINNNVNCTFVPDALFRWFAYMQGSYEQLPENGDFLIPFSEKDEYFGKFDFREPYICIGGSSLAAWESSRAIDPFCMLVESLKELGLKIYLVETCLGDSFLHRVSSVVGVPIVPVNISILSGGAILANARLFISGRYHPSILASLGDTPCIFLGSNSHKTASLQEVLGYNETLEFSAIPRSDEIDQIYKKAASMLSAGDNLRQRIRSVARQRNSESTKLLELIFTEHGIS